jgi:NAD(P)-dependent dehydrogenase (short-subunit alcohol dehydrogenase family)
MARKRGQRVRKTLGLWSGAEVRQRGSRTRRGARFATILAICEVTQLRAKFLVGHEDYELTAKVYQLHIEVSDEDLDVLETRHGMHDRGRLRDLPAARSGAARAAEFLHPICIHLHVLVNNAGVGKAESAQDTSARTMDRLLGVNLRAAMICTRAALPLLEASAPAYVINMSSYVGVHPGHVSRRIARPRQSRRVWRCSC